MTDIARALRIGLALSWQPSETERDHTQVLVLPITHPAPENHTDGIEIPPKVKRYLGLDADRSWIIMSEAHVFIWPGSDLRPVPGRKEATPYFGWLPPKLLKAILEHAIAIQMRHQAAALL
jgi:hypothetical protein